METTPQSDLDEEAWRRDSWASAARHRPCTAFPPHARPTGGPSPADSENRLSFRVDTGFRVDIKSAELRYWRLPEILVDRQPPARVGPGAQSHLLSSQASPHSPSRLPRGMRAARGRPFDGRQLEGRDGRAERGHSGGSSASGPRAGAPRKPAPRKVPRQARRAGAGAGTSPRPAGALLASSQATRRRAPGVPLRSPPPGATELAGPDAVCAGSGRLVRAICRLPPRTTGDDGRPTLPPPPPPPPPSAAYVRTVRQAQGPRRGRLYTSISSRRNLE